MNKIKDWFNKTVGKKPAKPTTPKKETNEEVRRKTLESRKGSSN